MTLTLASPPSAEKEDVEQRFVMRGIGWDAYVTICDALEDHSGITNDLQRREIDFHGKVSPSSRNWLSFSIISCWRSRSICRSNASRRAKRPIAAEKRRLGPREIALSILVPTPSGCGGWRTTTSRSILRPTSRSKLKRATPRMMRSPHGAGWACPRCGVSTRRLSACTFWNRRDDGTYEQVVQQHVPAHARSVRCRTIRFARARELGSSKWYRQLEDWVRDVIRPRLQGGES